VLCQRGQNEDCWTDVAPATRLVLALSESTALGCSLPSVVGRDHAGGRGVSVLGTGGASRLVGILGSSMLVGLHLPLIRVVLLNSLTAWHYGCLSLTLCR
jgi:hypothetical protein